MKTLVEGKKYRPEIFQQELLTIQIIESRTEDGFLLRTTA